MLASLALSWIIWVIALPLIGAVLSFVCGERWGRFIGGVASLGTVGATVGLVFQLSRDGPIGYRVGGWGSPLGIELYADGLAALMLLMGAVVGGFVTVYAFWYFEEFAHDREPSLNSGGTPASHSPHQSDSSPSRAVPEKSVERIRESFWPLWLFLWASLNALFLSSDIFNLYVTLELLTLASVALIGLADEPVALMASVRYLIVALAGSMFYLLGVALLYNMYGTVDMRLLAASLTDSPGTWWAIALMTVGLMFKTALFPLHFWLPAAHANAPAPVSAVMSGLVVKASFYLLLRLWVGVFPAALSPWSCYLLGGLGVAAIFWGAGQALRQNRLKLIVAYSTVAQIGYLFLFFPFMTNPNVMALAGQGVVYLALSHACAKGALFLAAGNIYHLSGHDSLDRLPGISQQLPMTVFAFALGGTSLMGLPPSGGFLAKWMLLNAGFQQGEWWIVVALLMGGLLAAAYLFRVLRQMVVETQTPRPIADVPRLLELTPVALALLSIFLGFIAVYPIELLQIGTPFSGPGITEGP